MPVVKPKLYSTWHCEFAQRARIALNAKGVDYELVEVTPYNKTAEWLAVNPRGLVPTIVDVDGRSVYESPICIEYIDERWPGEYKLLPGGPHERAQQRLWGDHITKKIVPRFFALLQKKTEEERKQAAEQLTEALRVLFTDPIISASPGPYFLGSQLTYGDIMLAPVALRIEPILKTYRNFKIPTTPEWTRYHQWLAAVRSNPIIQSTQADQEKLIESYAIYADNTAQSEVAEAIRKGEVLP